MADAVKDRYNKQSLGQVASDIKSVYAHFQADKFLEALMDEAWPDLGVKDRIYKISTELGRYLPRDYQTAIGIIDQVVMNYGDWKEGFGGFFPIFIELYGQDERNWDISMAAFAKYTPYASAEIAVRAFINNNEERMMKQMYAWSKHDSEFLRRLSCEGCRPQLPWALSLPKFKKDPAPLLPILEQLKDDPSMDVRKSVANNLNDISKTQPDIVAKLAHDWYGQSENTDWIVKHGCRTLLKKGYPKIMSIFGYNDTKQTNIEDFKLAETSISRGESITFSFIISASRETKVRLEYGIDYVKANGQRNRKVFKISESMLPANEKKSYIKKHSFADVGTRKHYPGIHSVALILNGIELETLDFSFDA